MPGDVSDAWAGVMHTEKGRSLPGDPTNEENRRASVQELPPVLDGKATFNPDYLDEDDMPTLEEIATLPHVADKIPWRIYSVAFVELCERFSYYGVQILFQNFVQRPLQTPTGAAPTPNGDTGNNPGALNQGQQTATGLSTFFSFWCYVTPLLGAWVADTYLGRYKTILISIAIALAGHIILIGGATPPALADSTAGLACYVVSLIVLGLGTGGFKPNISPLIAEQIVGEKYRVVTRNGQRVIIDPAATSARIYNWFYLFINIGAFIGQITMAYAVLYVGYWLGFLLPTIMFLGSPVVLIVFKKHYILRPPQGSVLGPAIKTLTLAQKGRWHLNPMRTIKDLRSMSFWEDVKPSHLRAAGRPVPAWMTFDDHWVDELRRGFKACTVFLWYPLYWVCYNQLNNNFTSQADTMQHAGVPPEIVAQLDPIALIVFIPICDLIIYPFLRKRGIRFTPIKKIALGFMCASASMIWATVIQNYIYTHNPCGRHPSAGLPDGSNCYTQLSIWAQTGSYVLLAFSEIFASITSLEYAFTKAPKNMRSMVQAVALFQTAFASAIGEALIALSADPLLVWNYGTFAVVSFIAGILFWITHRKLDSEEETLNLLPTGHVGTKSQSDAAGRRGSLAEVAHGASLGDIAHDHPKAPAQPYQNGTELREK